MKIGILIILGESVLTIKQQMNLNSKMYKLFDSYELGRMWKKTKSLNCFIALEDKAFVILKLHNISSHDLVFFKKGATITINNSLMEYYENDLI